MRSVIRSRRGVVTVLTLLLAAIVPARALQGPPGTGLPGNSDQRASDPCEQAVKPHGRALGVQAKCEPAGGGGVAKGDFNGDGIGDLAVGVPYEDSGSIEDTGAVNVIYGSANGLVATGNQLFFQGRSGTNIPGTAEEGDKFGWAIASGNFNGDGYSDLAVGIPGEDFAGLTDAGQVFIFHGSATGLTFVRFFDYRDFSQFGPPAAGDEFGYSLVWADFNADGAGDLAVGAPNRHHLQHFCEIVIGCIGIPETERFRNPSGGAVVAVYGGLSGLTVLGSQEVAQGDSPDECVEIVFCIADPDPRFGGELADGARFALTVSAGDFDGDGFDDLVAGVPLKDVNGALFAGEVHVIFGDGAGLRRDRFALLDQGSRDGTPEKYDKFGAALASGDFNNDGRDDLAVGVPFEDSSAGADTGIVQVFFGGGTTFSAFEQTFDQAAFPTTFDGREVADRFGYSLAAADFNGDGPKDLAIGVPGEDIGPILEAGIVHVVYGGNGLFGCCVGPAPQVWHQNTANVLGSAEPGDQFGFSLSAWNFGRTSHADLAVGVPFKDIVEALKTNIANAGAVNVIYGSATGLATAGNQLWTQNDLNGSPAEAGDQFGRVVY